ncbi:MAG: DUF362 domain-containing protein [Candidatus Marinimicrobia bacterium]|nr:DUF362 domain-containing protein [Candidatus Neomarinimicrobiota bacterium]
MERRKFLKTSILLAGGAVLGSAHLFGKSTTFPSVVLIKNGNPAEMVRKALDMLGGISRFISKNDVVLLKPNISWDRAPEYAATSNPELMSEVIRLCYQAGAKNVIVLDNTCNEARRCYKNSTLEETARKAGADVRFVRDNHFSETPIPNGTALKSWPIHNAVFEANKIINMPILKHHGMSKVTIGFKNMMGLSGGNRGRLHLSFSQKIVDLNRVIVPQLTIVDAIRILKENGPQGGNLADVEKLDTIIAGTDRVLVDAWSAKIFGLDPNKIEYLRIAHEAGMGEMDTDKFKPTQFVFKS